MKSCNRELINEWESCRVTDSSGTVSYSLLGKSKEFSRIFISDCISKDIFSLGFQNV